MFVRLSIFSYLQVKKKTTWRNLHMCIYSWTRCGCKQYLYASMAYCSVCMLCQHICMPAVPAACMPDVHVCLLCMYACCACVPVVHVCLLCMYAWCACMPVVLVCLLCMYACCVYSIWLLNMDAWGAYSIWLLNMDAWGAYSIWLLNMDAWGAYKHARPLCLLSLHVCYACVPNVSDVPVCLYLLCL